MIKGHSYVWFIGLWETALLERAESEPGDDNLFDGNHLSSVPLVEDLTMHIRSVTMYI